LLAAVAAVACTRHGEEPALRPPDDITAQSLRAPRDTGTNQISGLVVKREGAAVMLDSGGPTLIPLRIDKGTQVTIDGESGSAAEIREGDLVRAAYRFDDAGEPLALQVVANQRPVPTARIPQAPPGPSRQR
jgi:hypothetical protein